MALSNMLAFTILVLLLQTLQASKLKVLHPMALRAQLTREIHGRIEKGLIHASLGNFGHFNYGTTSKGRLHYPISNTDGCRPFKESDFNAEHLLEGKQQKLGSIILVDRGSCHFVVKA